MPGMDMSLFLMAMRKREIDLEMQGSYLSQMAQAVKDAFTAKLIAQYQLIQAEPNMLQQHKDECVDACVKQYGRISAIPTV